MITKSETALPDVLNGAGLREERIENANGLGPVPRSAKLRELDSLRDCRRHETETQRIERR